MTADTVPNCRSGLHLHDEVLDGDAVESRFNV
jgi:hypothetical protein